MENKTIDNLIVCSLKCEGINRSTNCIHNFLPDNSFDMLCLQKAWTIDSNINMLSNIYDFLFTGITGVDHTVDILQGRPRGGVSLLYRKSLSCYIKHIKIDHRRICAISITIVAYIILPCDTYLVNNVNSEFVDCTDSIENVLHSADFNHIIITGDFNTSFSRINTQSKCLSDVLIGNNLLLSWEHQLAKVGNIYNNLSLGHHSFNDNFLCVKT